MDRSNNGPQVVTRTGALLGAWNDGVAAFLGVPYAKPPTGELRFAAPVPAAPWEGVRSAEHQAPAPPQPVGRGDGIMGPMGGPGQDEDCLTLNVWTPSLGEGANAPVLVWLHGGGFMYGAGSANYYEGSVMARRGQVVVVTVNYRLGALGYLYLPRGLRGDRPVANLGLQDQLLALQWVRDNIAAFGGDPGNVTVAGQSAGALSIVGLSALPTAKGLFRRAILQSASVNVPAHQPDAAELITKAFLKEAGVDKGGAGALMALPVSEILGAQERTLIGMAMSAGGDPRLKPASMAPFQLVVDGEVLTEDPAAAAREGSMDHLDLLLSCTSEEMRFAYAADEAFWARDRASIVAEVKAAFGAGGVELFEIYEKAHPEKSPPEVLCDMLSEEGAVGAIDLADRRAAIGRPAYFAWFTWRSPGAGGRIGAAHTVELPFVFNNFDQWSDAPLLAGADPSTLRKLGDKIQDAWIAFARNGSPGEGWPPYTPPKRLAMELGDTVKVIADPAPNRSKEGITFATRRSSMTPQIGHLHHVGLVVVDMAQAIGTLKRLGFDLPPAAYPMIAPKEGAPPAPFGAGNTHVTFLRNFIELVTLVSDGGRIPDDAKLIPLEVPPAALPRIRETILRMVASLRVRLARFEGLHILVVQTPDCDAIADAYTAAGVGHSGANTVQRQIDTEDGAKMVPVRYLEIDGEPTPEGRLAVAENPASELMHAQQHMNHANGAIDLIESVLCVPDGEIGDFEARYSRYLGGSARREAGNAVFDLSGSRITIVENSALDAYLPGETAPALPAYVALAVSVRDLAATGALLRKNGLPVRDMPTGGLFVPASAALGAAVIFRQASANRY